MPTKDPRRRTLLLEHKESRDNYPKMWEIQASSPQKHVGHKVLHNKEKRQFLTDRHIRKDDYSKKILNGQSIHRVLMPSKYSSSKTLHRHTRILHESSTVYDLHILSTKKFLSTNVSVAVLYRNWYWWHLFFLVLEIRCTWYLHIRTLLWWDDTSTKGTSPRYASCNRRSSLLKSHVNTMSCAGRQTWRNLWKASDTSSRTDLSKRKQWYSITFPATCLGGNSTSVFVCTYSASMRIDPRHICTDFGACLQVRARKNLDLQ